MSNESNRFKNRISEHPNRRKLTIVSQNEKEIIADIFRADINIEEEGTKIDAKVLNVWDTKVNKAFALTQTPNIVEAGIVGVPSVQIAEDGSLKFRAIKGNTGAMGPIGAQGPAGAQGPQGTQGIQGERGFVGPSATFGKISANTVLLDEYADPNVLLTDTGNNLIRNLNFEFVLPKGIPGDAGNSIFVRYSYDKITMTEEPMVDTKYIGFYTGKTYSSEPTQYTWTNVWGAKNISMQDYSDMLIEDRIDQEQIYFVDGASDEKIEVVVNREMIASALGLNETQLMQLAELAKVTTVTGTTNKEISFAANSLNIQ